MDCIQVPFNWNIDRTPTVKLGEIHKCWENEHSAEYTQWYDSKINNIVYELQEEIYIERINGNGKQEVAQQYLENECGYLKMQLE